MTKAEEQAATEAALAEFLSKGGEIQRLKPNQSGRVEGAGYSNPWAKKKPSTSPLANPPEED